MLREITQGRTENLEELCHFPRLRLTPLWRACGRHRNTQPSVQDLACWDAGGPELVSRKRLNLSEEWEPPRLSMCWYAGSYAKGGKRIQEPGKEALSFTIDLQPSGTLSKPKAYFCTIWQRRNMYRFQPQYHKAGPKKGEMGDLELRVNKLITNSDVH